MLAGTDSFAVGKEKAAETVEWMNMTAKKNKQKFQSKLAGYSMQTVRFGSFEIISWSGDWAIARSIIRKASSKLSTKVIESGYHEKRDLLSAMFGGSEFGKVYSNGKLIGQIEMEKKSGKWKSRSESYT
jgi:hypothetical protein